MNYKCFIKLVKGNIYTYQLDSEKISILKRDGEDYQVYNDLEFWNWWKRKFNYNTEDVSFAVYTDEKEFKILEEIKISEKNFFTNEDIKNITQEIAEELPIIFYPKLNNLKVKVKFNKKIATKAKKESLAGYFHTLTKEIDRN